MEDLIFEKIYRETSRPLWAYVSRMSGSATSADDIVQETYLSFLRSPFKGKEVKDARPYLYKIATNLIYKRFHKTRHEIQPEIEMSQLPRPTSELVGQSVEMTEIFARLNERERSLLWLAYVDGYKHNEIASIMNINSMSVRVLLFRAKRKLATFFESEMK